MIEHRTHSAFDGLWLDERTVEWHIPVRCSSGFDGQLPLPESLVPGADAVDAICKALLNPYCHVVALVGAAGTGKTTALAWFLRTLDRASTDVRVEAIRCSSRTTAEVQEFLSHASLSDEQQLLVIDGLDEIRGEKPVSIDQLLQPVTAHILRGDLRILFSVRSNAIGHGFLVPPGEGLLTTLEWDGAWSGVQTKERLNVAILQLQELRHRDVETYANMRGLGPQFVAHLRLLYDLRELVRRFFLLVKLCDLSTQLNPNEWTGIVDRHQLYERLLTTWLKAEQERDPEKLPLDTNDLLTVLERIALHINRWTVNDGSPLTTRLSSALHELGGTELRGTDAGIIAAALLSANIVVDTGFAHKSMEEYLLARSLTTMVPTGATEPLSPSRVTDDVIGFLAENRAFNTWLDQHLDRLADIYPGYLPYIVRLLHKQGRAIPGLDLKEANLANLQLPGLRLRGADLSKANLEGTQLGPADLTNTKLHGAVLRNASVWMTQGATAIYPSSDGPDRAWLIRQSANRAEDEAVLVQIGFNEGRIVMVHSYDARTKDLQSDGRSLYLLPKIRTSVTEAIQWIGEKIAAERWTLLPGAFPLVSVTAPGSIWNVGAGQITLSDDDGIKLSFDHLNGSVGGVVGAPYSSEFSRHEIDGFCLIGSSLWVISVRQHIRLCDTMPLNQPINQIVVVGKIRLFFRDATGWLSWLPANNLVSRHQELDGETRIVAIPGGGFGIVRLSTVEFFDEDLNQVATHSIAANAQYMDMIGLRRGRRAALVGLCHDPQWLQIIDEQNGIEKAEWVQLRAQDARLNKTTDIDRDLYAALVRAGATDESATPQAPNLNISYSPFRQPSKPRFDVLLVTTVNDHEYNAVYDIARDRLGRELKPVFGARTYYDLETIGGVRVALVRSEMGSSSPGATLATTMQAINDLQPRYIIAVGILFGVNPDKQKIGQIFYSRQLQSYNLMRIGTDERTGGYRINPRDDKTTANPQFLSRVRDAADHWPEGKSGDKPQGILLLSGDKLVDNVDFRDQLLDLFPEAEAGEMEASGIYSATREEERRWMVIKAICDYADGKKKENKEERQKLAAEKAARFTFFLLDRGGLA